MIVKYKTPYHDDRIERVEVIRETAAYVYVAADRRDSGERRESKRGEFACYYDSWSQAHAALLEKADAQVLAARRALQRAQDKLGNIKGMKEPRQ